MGEGVGGGEGTHLLGEDRGNTRGARAGRCNVRDVVSFARTLDALRECTFFTRFSRCDIVPFPRRPGPRSNLKQISAIYKSVLVVPRAPEP